MTRTYDAVVLGGGLAGLTLARQLLQREDGLRVAVVEGKALPRSADTLRLGESTSEVGAWYLADRLGLGEHLRGHHVAKAGLRFFFADPRRRGLGRRPEYGLITPTPGIWSVPFEGTHVPTFQVHRGRLEHHLAGDVAARGADLVDRAAVGEVRLGDPHEVQVRRDGHSLVLRARWVVDATGGAGLLGGSIGQVISGTHQARATWFWVDTRLDPDRWSADGDFLERTPREVRWHSTCHFCGPGYWVWLIPLPSGQSSVGILADPARHPPLDGPDAVLAWLEQHEPELAGAVRTAGMPVPRSRTLRSYRATRILDDRRVALAGDTAGFLDPLYSPGIDFIALGNELITAAVLDAVDASDLARRCRLANVLHERLYGHFATLYDGLWELTGNPRVMAAKVTWDLPLYWAFVALWLMSGRVADPAVFQGVGDLSMRAARLNGRVQALVRDWARRDDGADAAGWIDQGASALVAEPLLQLGWARGDPDVRGRIAENVERLERLAMAIFLRAARSLEVPLPHGPFNPYAVSLDPTRWQADGLTAGRNRVAARADLVADTAPLWLDP